MRFGDPIQEKNDFDVNFYKNIIKNDEVIQNVNEEIKGIIENENGIQENILDKSNSSNLQKSVFNTIKENYGNWLKNISANNTEDEKIREYISKLKDIQKDIPEIDNQESNKIINSLISLFNQGLNRKNQLLIKSVEDSIQENKNLFLEENDNNFKDYDQKIERFNEFLKKVSILNTNFFDKSIIKNIIDEANKIVKAKEKVAKIKKDKEDYENRYNQKIKILNQELNALNKKYVKLNLLNKENEISINNESVFEINNKKQLEDVLEKIENLKKEIKDFLKKIEGLKENKFFELNALKNRNNLIDIYIKSIKERIDTLKKAEDKIINNTEESKTSEGKIEEEKEKSKTENNSKNENTNSEEKKENSKEEKQNFKEEEKKESKTSEVKEEEGKEKLKNNEKEEEERNQEKINELINKIDAEFSTIKFDFFNLGAFMYDRDGDIYISEYEYFMPSFVKEYKNYSNDVLNQKINFIKQGLTGLITNLNRIKSGDKKCIDYFSVWGNEKDEETGKMIHLTPEQLKSEVEISKELIEKLIPLLTSLLELKNKFNQKESKTENNSKNENTNSEEKKENSKEEKQNSKEEEKKESKTSEGKEEEGKEGQEQEKKEMTLEEKIEKAIGEKIQDCYDIHTQPNGDLAGRVQINLIWYPFAGDKVIKEIGGEKIEFCDNIHTQANGDLAGRVQINLIWYPFAGDKVIKEIGGEKIEHCFNIHTQANGDLAGTVRINGIFAVDKIIKSTEESKTSEGKEEEKKENKKEEDKKEEKKEGNSKEGKKENSKEENKTSEGKEEEGKEGQEQEKKEMTLEEKIEKAIGEKIQDCDHIHTQANGDLAGRVVLINGTIYPFAGDKVIKEIGGEKIQGCFYIHTQPNGDLAGRVKINGISYPFVGDKLFKEIGGEKIQGCDNIHTQPNGNLAGEVRINGIVYPFAGDKVIKEIGGEKIQGCACIHTKANGDLAGEVKINGIMYPFVGDKVIKEIGGEKIESCFSLSVHTQPNGDLAGEVKINGISYPFVGDKLIKKIGGEKIQDCYDIHTQPNGDLAGRVQINGISYPFVGDKLIKKIGGEKIQGCAYIHTQPNGDLAGRVKINGIWYPFVGDKIIKSTEENKNSEGKKEEENEPKDTLYNKIKNKMRRGREIRGGFFSDLFKKETWKKINHDMWNMKKEKLENIKLENLNEENKKKLRFMGVNNSVIDWYGKQAGITKIGVSFAMTAAAIGTGVAFGGLGIASGAAIAGSLKYISRKILTHNSIYSRTLKTKMKEMENHNWKSYDEKFEDADKEAKKKAKKAILISILLGAGTATVAGLIINHNIDEHHSTGTQNLNKDIFHKNTQNIFNQNRENLHDKYFHNTENNNPPQTPTPTQTTAPTKSPALDISSEDKNLDNNQKESFDPKKSIVDYLHQHKEDASLAHRAELAKEYGIKDYKGTAEQNESLLKKLLNGDKPKNNLSDLNNNSTDIDELLDGKNIPESSDLVDAKIDSNLSDNGNNIQENPITKEAVNHALRPSEMYDNSDLLVDKNFELIHDNSHAILGKDGNYFLPKNTLPKIKEMENGDTYHAFMDRDGIKGEIIYKKDLEGNIKISNKIDFDLEDLKNVETYQDYFDKNTFQNQEGVWEIKDSEKIFGHKISSQDYNLLQNKFNSEKLNHILTHPKGLSKEYLDHLKIGAEEKAGAVVEKVEAVAEKVKHFWGNKDVKEFISSNQKGSLKDFGDGKWTAIKDGSNLPNSAGSLDVQYLEKFEDGKSLTDLKDKVKYIDIDAKDINELDSKANDLIKTGNLKNVLQMNKDSNTSPRGIWGIRKFFRGNLKRRIFFTTE